MAQILDGESGEKYLCGHQNGGEISSRKLGHSGPCNPIGMENFATRDKDMEHEFSGVEKFLQETFLPRLFLGKSKTFLLL